jgi:hypothetical protein
MRRHQVASVSLIAIVLSMSAPSLAFVLTSNRWCQTDHQLYDYSPALLVRPDLAPTIPWATLQWNLVEPASFAWQPTLDPHQNQVFFAPLGSELVGATLAYPGGAGCLAQTDVYLDSGEIWHPGVNDPPAPNQLDLMGAVIHEFGHASGIAETNLSCTGSFASRPTMCPDYGYGVDYFRTLTTDDIDAFNAYYGCPALQALAKSPELSTPESARAVEFAGWRDQLYQLRDAVLAGTTLGDRLIRFQRANATEAAVLIATHPRIQRKLLKLLEVGSPALFSLVSGDGSVVFSRGIYATMQSYVRAIARHGSPEMRAQIREIWKALDLRRQVGRTVGAIWQERRSEKPESSFPSFHATYLAKSYEERVAEADTILVGKVQRVSATRWNQDSGESWEPDQPTSADHVVHVPLPFYTVEIENIQSVVPEGSAAESVSLTIVGISPNDRAGDGVELQPGDQVLILARQVDLPWKDGTRSILGLIGDPTESFLRQRADGLYETKSARGAALTLDELVAQIKRMRSLP